MKNCGKLMFKHLENLATINKKVMNLSHTGSSAKAGAWVAMKAKGSRIMPKGI
jgi:hypothetical protein